MSSCNAAPSIVLPCPSRLRRCTEADLAKPCRGHLERSQGVRAVGISDSGIRGGRGARVRCGSGGEGVVGLICGGDAR